MSDAPINDLPKDILKLLQQSENAKLSGDHLTALDFAERALQKQPDCVEALEEVADNYLALEELTKAKNAAEFAYELDSASYTALYILGFIESRGGNHEQAIEFLEKANALRPNNAEILRALGWAYFMSGKNMKGVVILERALNLNQDDPMILCDLGVCYLKDEQSKKALDLFYRAMEINPDDERVQECVRLAQEVEAIGKK